MKDQLTLLIRLQELDLQRNQQQEECQKLPERLQIAQQSLDRAKALLSQERALLDQLNKEKKEKEDQLRIIEEKTVKLKSKVTELKTNKEYQAYLCESAAAKSEQEKAEDVLLMVMEKGDSQRKTVASCEAMVASEEKMLVLEKSEVEEASRQLLESARNLDRGYMELQEKIEKGILENYKRLASIRKGVVVVPLKGATCSGCHFSLPPQLVAEVKMGIKIHTCSYCHRILYAAG